MTEGVNKESIQWRFLLPLILGTMLNPLNSTMLATALMNLCQSFKVSIGQGAILITSLYITSTVAQPLMGRLADIYSPKKINTIGFILALAAAIVGIAAPGFEWLIVSRILLGLGTSAAYPSAMAIINRKYAEAGKAVPGRVLGIIAISAQVSMVLGPVLGGLLTQWFNWRGIFMINIPWVIVAIILSQAIPDYPPAKANSDVSLFKRLDAVGIVIFSGFLLALLFTLINHQFTWILPVIAIMLFIMLILWERKQPSPFIDVRLLASKPALLMVYLRTLATTYILYQVLYAIPQWLEGIKLLSPAKTGLMMLPESAMAMLSAYVIAKSKNIFGQNLTGVTVMLLACIGWFTLGHGSSIIYILGITLILGVAEGVNIIANQALLNQEAPLAQKGVSFGLMRTFGYLGAIISSTQIKMLFHNGVSDQSFHLIGVFTICSSLLLAVLLIPLWFRRKVLQAGS